MSPASRRRPGSTQAFTSRRSRPHMATTADTISADECERSAAGGLARHSRCGPLMWHETPGLITAEDLAAVPGLRAGVLRALRGVKGADRRAVTERILAAVGTALQETSYGEIGRLSGQVERAHDRLDQLGLPRAAGRVTYTLAGRLALIDDTRRTRTGRGGPR